MTDTILLVGYIHKLAYKLAECLKEDGFQIIMAGKNCADETLSPFIELNLNDPADLQASVLQLPDFDSVIIFPGWYGHGDFLDTTNLDWESALTENFYHMVYVGQAIALAFIARKKPGKLLYMSSTMGIRPTVETIAQGTTFTMLESLVKTAAVDLAEHQITVNLIAHGWVDLVSSTDPIFPRARPEIEQDVPLKRTGLPKDIASLIAFLMSQASVYITGAVIPVDGGALLTKSAFSSPYQ
ncbi:MAG: SDR family oxidoreductase [Aggregatilineales bacterium]